MGEIILSMHDISKTFPGVKALNKVSLNVYAGEVMALLGENGAGKSTLMKILSGVYKLEEGVIHFEGRDVVFDSPGAAQKGGIAIIHQELNMIPHMRIYENIFLGREMKKKGGRLDKKGMICAANELLGKIGVTLDATWYVSQLSIAQQQMVEIAKAVSLNAKVIVMDEPTDTLPDADVENLFRIIEKLRNEGKGIVYISHRLKEIFAICDRVTVLRDGTWIGERAVAEINEDELIKMMVGRTLDEQYPYINTVKEEEVLRVQGLSNQYVHNISFSLKRGELLGIAGLVGAGRTELARTLFGVYPPKEGEIKLHQKSYAAKTPRQALDQGICYISEDRKKDGLILILDVKNNITVSSLKKLRQGIMLNKRKELECCEDYRRSMNIKTPSIYQKVGNLSGGNQQKVALSKGIMTEPEVLIMDEPTRGVDVGAKKEIYGLLNELKESGKSIIMISSDMPEILGMSDRVLVMNEGKLKGELSRAEATQEKIMQMIVAQPEKGAEV